MRDIDRPPVPPENIRVIDVHGAEVRPVRVVYLGPDPEDDMHAFEAWFAPGVDLPARPQLRIGKLPGKTSLSFRFLA